MLFEMSQPKFKKRKLWDRKISQASYQVPCEKFLILLDFPSWQHYFPASPSVIILLADDLGFGDLSFSGHPTSRTPNIDRSGGNIWGRGEKYLAQTDEFLGETELSLHWLPSLLPLPGSSADRSGPAVPVVPLVSGNVLIVRALSRVYWSLPGSFLPRRLGGTQCWA